MQWDWEWDWFTKINPIFRVEDAVGIVARWGGRIVAMAVFDNWLPNSVQSHLVIRDRVAVDMGFGEAAYALAFGADRGMVLGQVPSDKPRALELCLEEGYEVMYRVADGLEVGVDLIMVRLLRKNCRFLGE